MRVRLCLLTAALALVPVACSVVDGGKVQRVDAPRELTDTLPTTTTTAATTTTLAVSTTTGLETTTTEVRVEGVRLYFIASGKLSPVIGSLPSEYALSQLIALLPLLLSADAPGKEVLHPVAVVIFGGLISSTLLDTLLTPLMFWLWGRPALERLLAAKESESF